MSGELVRKARSARGMTQAEVAVISGIKQANVSAIEHGRRVPSAATLQRLLEACGFELTASAGDLVLGGQRGVGPHDPAPQPMDMATRVKKLNAALELADAIVRSR